MLIKIKNGVVKQRPYAQARTPREKTKKTQKIKSQEVRRGLAV